MKSEAKKEGPENLEDVHVVDDIKDIGGVKINDDVREILRESAKRGDSYKNMVEAIKDSRSGKEWYKKYSKDGNNAFNLRQDLESSFFGFTSGYYESGYYKRMGLKKPKAKESNANPFGRASAIIGRRPGA